MPVHRRVTPSIKFAGTHLYTWVERGTVRVKCLAQQQNTMSPARARTRTARSGDERTNHEATARGEWRGGSLYLSSEFQALSRRTFGSHLHVAVICPKLPVCLRKCVLLILSPQHFIFSYSSTKLTLFLLFYCFCFRYRLNILIFLPFLC